jgi:aldehyde:ferredoxin oxidoreductase
MNVLSWERKFNIEAGFTKAHDRLPEYFRLEELAPHNKTFEVPDTELDTVFNW